MKKIIKLRSKIIYSTLVALGLSLSSLSHSQYLFTPPKAKSAEVLQLYLSQQRIQAGLQSKTLKVGDVTWSYSEGGAKNKPSIILIHGLAGTRDNWNRVAQFLTPIIMSSFQICRAMAIPGFQQILICLYPMSLRNYVLLSKP
jgi:hypothetical protein